MAAIRRQMLEQTRSYYRIQKNILDRIRCTRKVKQAMTKPVVRAEFYHYIEPSSLNLSKPKKKAVDIVIFGKPTKLVPLVFLQDKLENTPDQRSILSPTYLRY